MSDKERFLRKNKMGIALIAIGCTLLIYSIFRGEVTAFWGQFF